MQQSYGFGPSTPEDLCILQVFDVILSFADFLRLSQFHIFLAILNLDTYVTYVMIQR